MAKKKSEDKNNQNGEINKQDGDSFANDEMPNFSDPEDFVDDVSDEGMLTSDSMWLQCCIRRNHFVDRLSNNNIENACFLS